MKELDDVRESLERAIVDLSYYDGFNNIEWEKALAGIAAVEAEMTSLKEQVERMRKYMKEDGYFDSEEKE